jgi:hypothetical protein
LTTVTSTTTSWINVTAAKPVNYYLGLLESNRTEPYMSLAREFRKLPDLTNATAVTEITYLALNATNPEVKEALDMMIKGERPAQVTSRAGACLSQGERLWPAGLYPYEALYELARDKKKGGIEGIVPIWLTSSRTQRRSSCSTERCT